MDSWIAPSLPDLPGTGPQLRLYDSARRGVHPTGGASGDRTMYVCGITPYDATHLGHAATMIAFDLVNRVWRDAGHDVRYVQNVTDIDDPLLERANRDGEDWIVLAMRETALFREDMEALRILPPAHYVGAVESIPAIVGRVVELVDRGAAYRLDDGTGDVYFDLTAAPRFGYESNLDRDDDAAARRPSGAVTRTGPASATRWTRCCGGAPATASRPGPAAPLGPGRPGWHIECAVIAWTGSATVVDVQGGGNDLLYPHHECSAAHAEVLTGAGAVRPALRARRDDRAGRREDVEVQGQPGLRLPPARRRRRPDGRPPGPDGRSTTGPTGSGPTTCSRPASSGWPLWRAAAAAAAGPSGADAAGRPAGGARRRPRHAAGTVHRGRVRRRRCRRRRSRPGRRPGCWRRPWTPCSAYGCRTCAAAARLVATDLDGTLLRSDGTVSARTQRALHDGGRGRHERGAGDRPPAAVPRPAGRGCCRRPRGHLRQRGDDLRPGQPARWARCGALPPPRPRAGWSPRWPRRPASGSPSRPGRGGVRAGLRAGRTTTTSGWRWPRWPSCGSTAARSSSCSPGRRPARPASC